MISWGQRSPATTSHRTRGRARCVAQGTWSLPDDKKTPHLFADRKNQPSFTFLIVQSCRRSPPAPRSKFSVLRRPPTRALGMDGVGDSRRLAVRHTGATCAWIASLPATKCTDGARRRGGPLRWDGYINQGYAQSAWEADWDVSCYYCYLLFAIVEFASPLVWDQGSACSSHPSSSSSSQDS